MTYYNFNTEPFSEIEFVGGKDAKGRVESWFVTVESTEWYESERAMCGFRPDSPVIGKEFYVTTQKKKDGKNFGASQRGLFASTEAEINKIIKKARQKAEKSASH